MSGDFTIEDFSPAASTVADSPVAFGKDSDATLLDECILDLSASQRQVFKIAISRLRKRLDADVSALRDKLRCAEQLADERQQELSRLSGEVAELEKKAADSSRTVELENRVKELSTALEASQEDKQTAVAVGNVRIAKLEGALADLKARSIAEREEFREAQTEWWERERAFQSLEEDYKRQLHELEARKSTSVADAAELGRLVQERNYLKAELDAARSLNRGIEIADQMKRSQIEREVALKRQLDEQQDQIDKTRLLLTQMENVGVEERREIESLKAALKEVHPESTAKLNIQLSTALEQIALLEANKADLQNEIEALRRDDTVEKYEALLEQKSEELERVQSEYALVSEDLKMAVVKCSRAEGRNEDLQMALSIAQESIAKFEVQMAELTEALDSSYRQTEQLRSDKTQLEELISSLESSVGDLTRKLDEEQMACNALQSWKAQISETLKCLNEAYELPPFDCIETSMKGLENLLKKKDEIIRAYQEDAEIFKNMLSLNVPASQLKDDVVAAGAGAKLKAVVGSALRKVNEEQARAEMLTQQMGEKDSTIEGLRRQIKAIEDGWKNEYDCYSLYLHRLQTQLSELNTERSRLESELAKRGQKQPSIVDEAKLEAIVKENKTLSKTIGVLELKCDQLRSELSVKTAELAERRQRDAAGDASQTLRPIIGHITAGSAALLAVIVAYVVGSTSC